MGLTELKPKSEEEELDSLRCRISWEFRDGSKKGHGEPVFNLKEAEEFAGWANQEFPYILHWAEPCYFYGE